MSGVQILVGADPEVFMRRDGKFISAHGAVQGDKANPFKVDKGAVQVDGMALEFNIDPAASEEEFVTNIQTVMKILGGMVPDYELVPDPVAHFGFEYLEQQPPEALELGCEADYNAWEGGAVNPRPDGRVDFRTGAGHIHVGWTKDQDVNDPEHIEACIMLVKQLDVYLGVPSLVWDTNNERRKLYGKAGAFRVKPYGVEYRVLSNAWLRSPGLIRWVYNATIKATNDLLKGVNKGDAWPQVQRIINTCRIDQAKAYAPALGLPCPSKVA